MFPPELKFLIACGRSPERAAYILPSIQAACDWPLVLDLAENIGLIPLVARAIHEACLQVPPDFAAAVSQLAAARTMRTLGMVAELTRLLRLFEDEGLTPIAFKGPVLGYLAYGDLALRDSTDLDIYVPREQVVRAVELLAAHSYSKKSRGFNVGLAGACEVALQRTDPACEVDLHWYFCPPYFAKLDGRRVLDRSVVVKVSGLSARTLCPEDLLLYLCLHGGRDCWGLRSICDIAAVTRKLSINWEDLFREAGRASAGRVLATGLLLAARLFAAQLPERVETWCGGDAAARQTADAVESRFTQTGSATRSTAEIRLHLRMMGSASRKLGYLWRRAMQPNHLDADFVHLPEGLNAAYYAVRPLRIACVALRIR